MTTPDPLTKEFMAAAPSPSVHFLVIAVPSPLVELAVTSELHMLLKPGLPVVVTDLVIEDLRGNTTANRFLEEQIALGKVTVWQTGVPEKAALYRELDKDPAHESLRIALKLLSNFAHHDDYATVLLTDEFLSKNTFLPIENVELVSVREFMRG